MKELKINHAAVWVSVVVLFVLGYLWYSPLFGDQWMALVGLDPAEVEANPPGAGPWITNIVATVIPLYVLAWLFTKLHVRSATQGAMIGLLFSFAFIFLARMASGMFARDPYALAWIEGGYDMVAMTIAGGILGGWRKYRTE